MPVREKRRRSIAIIAVVCIAAAALVFLFRQRRPAVVPSTVVSVNGANENTTPFASISDDAIQPEDVAYSNGVVNAFTNETYYVRMMKGDERCGDSRVCDLVKEQAGRRVLVAGLAIPTAEGTTRRGATLLGFAAADTARLQYVWSDAPGEHREIGTLRFPAGVFTSIVSETIVSPDPKRTGETADRFEITKDGFQFVFANQAVPGRAEMAARGAYLVENGVVSTLDVAAPPFLVDFDIEQNEQNAGELVFTLNGRSLTYNFDTKRFKE